MDNWKNEWVSAHCSHNDAWQANTQIAISSTSSRKAHRLFTHLVPQRSNFFTSERSMASASAGRCRSVATADSSSVMASRHGVFASGALSTLGLSSSATLHSAAWAVVTAKQTRKARRSHGSPRSQHCGKYVELRSSYKQLVCLIKGKVGSMKDKDQRSTQTHPASLHHHMATERFNEPISVLPHCHCHRT